VSTGRTASLVTYLGTRSPALARRPLRCERVSGVDGRTWPDRPAAGRCTGTCLLVPPCVRARDASLLPLRDSDLKHMRGS